MHVAIVSNCTIPVVKYGGIERIIWWLGKQLVNHGHKVTYIVKNGSHCNFAIVQFLSTQTPIEKQIPPSVDVVHFNGFGEVLENKPFIVTEHGNMNNTRSQFHPNSVFVSKNHAQRFGSTTFVHNGLDFDDYQKPTFNKARTYAHFLADAAWKVKNVTGAIKITKLAHEKLAVLGGTRINFNMGLRITLDAHVKFYGKVGGTEKMDLLNKSKALIFPVLWHEPFGIAIIESLYYGCPVLGTPFGSLPELVNNQVGLLSTSYTVLADALKNIGQFNAKHCHDYVVEYFSAKAMAEKYITLYEKVLNGEPLNTVPPQLIEQSPKYLQMVD